jgi:hypothetical protein
LEECFTDFFLIKPRMPFRYVSVHAPVKNREPDESGTIAMLDGLPLWVRSVVAHPDALADIVRYRALGTRLALENMDDRKTTGRVADELESFFEELPGAAFCLDVAHVRSIDPTMGADSLDIQALVSNAGSRRRPRSPPSGHEITAR